ncbi:MAG: 2OG-Fe(II) oxygenase [Dongiaceae bacterium]
MRRKAQDGRDHGIRWRACGDRAASESALLRLVCGHGERQIFTRPSMNASVQTAPPGARYRLEPGDRFPDFALPDQVGTVRSLYQRARGMGMALFLDSDEGLRTSLRALAEEYQAARLDSFLIDANTQGVDAMPCVFADVSGRFRQGVREMSGQASGAGARPLAILLDRNQHILALSDQGDLARWALTRWKAEPPPPAGEVGQVAPVLVIPNVLSRAECRALIARWHEMGHQEGTVTSVVKDQVVERVHEDVKKRLDHNLSDPAVRKPLMALIGRRIGPELNKAFCFGSFRFDRVLIARYDAERGDRFRPHRDNTTPATAGRRLALTLNLNSDEYEGGELIFPEYGDHRYKPPAGAAVVFSCSLLHEALPVTRGQRFALLSFLLDLEEPGKVR